MGGNNETEITSPAQTAGKMNFIAGSNEVFYNDFKALFDKQREESFIRNKYELIKQIRTDKSLISTLALVRYENNKLLLIKLRHDIKTGEYLIYDVIQVPEETASFFKEELY